MPSLPSTTSILLVARHALVRAGLRAVLAENPGLSVVAEARDVSDAMPVARALEPDVVLLNDIVEPAMADALRHELPDVCIVCLGDGTTTAGITCVPADGGVRELCSVLGAALSGRCAGCAFRTHCPARAIAAALSPRETQVAVCVSRGLSSKQIAGTLGISLRTVNTYREALARKLGSSSAAVVTRFVLEQQVTAQI